MSKKTVLVLGAGNIGSLIAHLLDADYDYEVVLGDKDVVKVSTLLENTGVMLTAVDASSEVELKCLMATRKFDIVVSALPYSCNKLVATVAAENGSHYFDLTEDVGVKNHLVELSKQFNTILMPQCGLAPGFINIVGNSLMQEFDDVFTAKLRVGALPQQVSNAFNYALTWSTNGLVNEYGNPCEAVVDGKYVDNLQPLEGVEKLLLDGVEYEAFNTSGGLGTLAETWDGLVKNLNYKTLRYPGHCEKIRFLMTDMNLNHNRELLENLLEWSIPTTTQDVIVIYAAVSGMKDGKFIERSYVNKVYPKTIGGRTWTGIQVTTAAGLCAAVDLTVEKVLTGFVKQESISVDEFLNNKFGKLYNNV